MLCRVLEQVTALLPSILACTSGVVVMGTERHGTTRSALKTSGSLRQVRLWIHEYHSKYMCVNTLYSTGILKNVKSKC